MSKVFFNFNKRKAFPNPELAAPENDFCIGIGGDLSVSRLLNAYRKGIFPWFSVDGLVHWFCPDPRCVLYPSAIHVSHSMKQLLNQKVFEVTFDQNFSFVINQCAQVKRKTALTESWITDDFIQGYTNLHIAGYAHSVEVWKDGNIVGGLYGVCIGKCFSGESMFSNRSNASKYGFIVLAKKLQELNFAFIDCQVPNPHLHSLGAKDIDRKTFLAELKKAVRKKTIKGNWGGML